MAEALNKLTFNVFKGAYSMNNNDVLAVCTISPHSSSIREIHGRIKNLGWRDRGSLLSKAKRILRDKQCHENLDIRIFAVKTVIALLPDSIKEIRFWFSDSTSSHYKHKHEVIFTLLCYLEEINEVPSINKKVRHELLSIVHGFLLYAKGDRQSSTWMAGDMLGDHWNRQEALPILLDVIDNGKYVDGRMSALGGIFKVCKKLPDKQPLKKALLEKLKKNKTTDRSRTIRAYIEMGGTGSVLAEKRCQSAEVTDDE
jgi:hypothetical protein